MAQVGKVKQSRCFFGLRNVEAQHVCCVKQIFHAGFFHVVVSEARFVFVVRQYVDVKSAEVTRKSAAVVAVANNAYGFATQFMSAVFFSPLQA